MGKLSFGAGSVRIQMDDTLDRIYRRAIDKLAPGLLPAVETAIDDLHADAYAAWPVKTGRSKEALEHLTSVSPDNKVIRGTITDDVPYARFIKAKSLGGKSAFVELLRKPLRERAKELVKVLGRVTNERLSHG